MRDIINTIIRESKTYPYLNAPLYYKSFEEMEKILFTMYNLVSEHSNYITDQYISIIIKISSLSRNSTIYHYFNNNENKNSIMRSSDLNFLGEGFNFIYSILKEKPYDVTRLNLNRGILKNIYYNLYLLLKEYVNCSSKYLEVKLNISKSNAYKLKEYEDKMSDIVRVTGISNAVIYGIFNQLEYFLSQYDIRFDSIYKSYLRIVAKRARVIVKSRLDAFPDAYQNGTAGLSKAINYFNISKGYSFKTYADYWVRKIILECSDSEASILPISNLVWRRYNKFEKIRQKTKGKISDYNFIAEETGIDCKKVEEVYRTVNNRKVERLDALLLSDSNITLLDTIKQTTFNVIKNKPKISTKDFDKDASILIHLLFGIEMKENNIGETLINEEIKKQKHSQNKSEV